MIAIGTPNILRLENRIYNLVKRNGYPIMGEHITEYSPKELLALLSNNGFRAIKNQGAILLPRRAFQIKRIWNRVWAKLLGTPKKDFRDLDLRLYESKFNIALGRFFPNVAVLQFWLAKKI